METNSKEIENLNRSLTSKEIKLIIFKNPTKECPGSGGFTGEFSHTFKGELIPILQKLPKNRIFPNLFYEIDTTLIPKPDTDYHESRKLQTNIFYEY